MRPDFSRLRGGGDLVAFRKRGEGEWREGYPEQWVRTLEYDRETWVLDVALVEGGVVRLNSENGDEWLPAIHWRAPSVS